MRRLDVPEFRPHPLLYSAHLQTLAAYQFSGKVRPYRAVQRRVPLADGDQLVLHDDCPASWRPGDRTALMVPVFSGNHMSPYVARPAATLAERGVRVFRMNLRGCGAGEGLARSPVHAGDSPDLAASLKYIAQLCPGSPTTIVGVSLGGSLILKLVGECGDSPPGGLDSALAASPPIDWPLCAANMHRLLNRFYDRRILRSLLERLRSHLERTPGLRVDFPRRPRCCDEFHAWFTAPAAGYASLDEYYRAMSAAPLLHRVRVPTLIISSRDDPLLPVQQFEEAACSPWVQLALTRYGGHAGFVARAGIDPSRWWLDWRIVDWVTCMGIRAARVPCRAAA
jgi:predicted alpha/beta-fold hydrolase